MSVTARTPLGSTQLARDYWLDVNIGTAASPNWIGVHGVMEFTPNQAPTTQDSGDFDSGGYGDEDITEIKWSCSGKLKRAVQGADPAAYDPGQEVLRLAANQLGNGNRVHVRWYEMPGGVIGAVGPHIEAYEGYANVQWNPDGGAKDGLRTVSFTLGGKGKRNAITHPQSGQAVPSVTAVEPPTSGTAGGALVIVSGSGFLSATAVQIGVTTVPTSDWEAISDSKMAIKTPAKAAGTYNVTVTNAAGTSATSAANQIVYS